MSIQGKSNPEIEGKDIEEKKKIKISNAEVYTNIIVNTALTMSSIHKNSLDIKTVVDALMLSISSLQKGDISEIEEMLMTQALTLNVLFHKILTRIDNTQTLQHIQIFSDLALKAQNQCQKTLARLAEIKNPKRFTFVKQQNLAVNQQVNNLKSNYSEISKNPEPANELLRSDNHESLEHSRTAEAIQFDTSVGTMEELYRPKNSTG